MTNNLITFHWDDLDDRFDEEKDIIEVDRRLSLFDAQAAFNANNIAQIKQWLLGNRLREISDETADAWFKTNQQLNALETEEWILLQLPE
ncbi:MAG: DUF2288 family protein [Cellvibrio sp.]